MSPEPRQGIQEAFAPLVGLPLTDMYRYLGFQKFEIGEQRRHVDSEGEETAYADWGLVVGGHWRITGPAGFLLSDNHFGPSSERRDAHAQPFYDRLEDAPLTVRTIKVGEDGGVRLELSDGFALDLPARPYAAENGEDWRLMPPDETRGHLVLERGEAAWSGQ